MTEAERIGHFVKEITESGYYVGRQFVNPPAFNSIKWIVNQIQGKHGNVNTLYHMNPLFDGILRKVVKVYAESGLLDYLKQLLDGDMCFIGSSLLYGQAENWHRDTLTDSDIEPHFRHFVRQTTSEWDNSTGDNFQVYKILLYLQESQVGLLPGGQHLPYPMSITRSKVKPVHVEVSPGDVVIWDLRTPHADVADVNDLTGENRGQIQLTVGKCASLHTIDQTAWTLFEYEMERLDVARNPQFTLEGLNAISEAGMGTIDHLDVMESVIAKHGQPPPRDESREHRKNTLPDEPKNNLWTQIGQKVYVGGHFAYQVAGSNQAMITLASGVKSVELEVGLWTSSERFETVRNDPTVAIVGFEPMISVWNSSKGRQRILNAGTNGTKFFYIPAAVSQPGGWKPFMYVPQAAGCSTLEVGEQVNNGQRMVDQLRSVQAEYVPCVVDVANRHRAALVPTVTLDSVMDRIEVQPIALLKIDAQGHEWDIIQSGKRGISRVKRIILELQDVPKNHWAKMYRRQPSIQDAQKLMKALGFQLLCCSGTHAKLWQADCLFLNLKQYNLKGLKRTKRYSPKKLFHPSPWDLKQRVGHYNRSTGLLIDQRNMDGFMSYKPCL